MQKYASENLLNPVILASSCDSQGKNAQYCARRFLGYGNHNNAALAASPKKVFLTYASLLRAKITCFILKLRDFLNEIIFGNLYIYAICREAQSEGVVGV